MRFKKYLYPELKAMEQDFRWAHKYCAQLISGDITAGRWMRLAAERHFAMMDDDQFYFDEEAAKSVVLFFKFVPITDGVGHGKPTKLAPWQIWVVTSLMAWKYKATGLLVFNYAYIQVARKAGKSTLAAGLTLYKMYKSGQMRPRAYSVATKRDQAKIMWDSAKAMIRMSPQLSAIFDPRANEILMPDVMGEFRPLASDSHSLDGLLPLIINADEVHSWRDRNLYGVLVSAFGATVDGLMFSITTAGFNLDGVCTDLNKNGKRVLSGEVEQWSYFYAIYEADPTDQWDDPQVWYKSNPGLIYGLPSMKYLKDRCQEAQMSSEEKGNFLTKHLNLFVAGADKWLNLDDVKACREPLDMSDYVLDKAYGFIDRSEVLDITTIGAIVPTPDGGCAAFFLNLMGTRGMESANDYLQGVYRKAIDEGDMVLLPSPTIDDVHVKEHSIEFFSQWKDVEMIGFDPWHMRQAADELTALNHPMVEVRQSTGNMSEPAKKLESLIINKLFKYDSRLFEYACSCALMGVTRQGNVVIFKESGSKTDKIDPLVGAIIGLSCATLQKVETHVYEERGLLML